MLRPNKTGMDIPLSYVYYQLALPPAIEYLKETKKVRTDADLARKLQISKSYLSQILKGEKPITQAFLDKLENVFKINLKDTDTFTDHRWLKALSEREYPDFSAKSFLVTYRHLRSALHARSMIIKAQGKLIEALQEDNENMAGMLDRFRSVMLEAKLKNPDIDTHQ